MIQDDYYEIYLEELEEIIPLMDGEEPELLAGLLNGDVTVKSRLIEGYLKTALELARGYEGRGLSLGDLVQEANVALALAAETYTGGNFSQYAQKQIEEALHQALEKQSLEQKAEEEVAARVNVLQEVSRVLAEELGREATIEELAAKMKMTVEEIRDIMKVTLNALSVSKGVS